MRVMTRKLPIIMLIILALLLSPIEIDSQSNVQTSKTIYASSYFKVEKNENGSYTIRPVNYTSFLVVSPTKLSIVTSTGNFDLRFPSGASITTSGNNIVVKCGNINHIFRLLEYGGYMFKPRKRVIKWNITINSPKDIPSSISFPIEGNIKPLLMLNNSILTIPEYNITFGRIIVIDANNNTFNMTYKIDGGKLYFEPENFTIDKLAFPIVIDPAIVFGNEIVLDDYFDPGDFILYNVDTLDENKVIICYATSTSSKAVVGIINNNTISLCTPTIFHPSRQSAITVTALNSTKFVVAYEKYNDSVGGYVVKLKVGIINDDNSITFGDETTVSLDGQYTIAMDNLTNDKIVIAYKNHIRVCTISGTSVTLHSEYAFTSSSVDFVGLTVLNSNRVLICWGNNCRVGTISGTSITFGSVYSYTAHNYPGSISVTRLNDEKALRAYGNAVGGYYYPYGRVITTNNLEISFGSPHNLVPVEPSYVEGTPVIKSFNETRAILCIGAYSSKAIYEHIDGTTITYSLIETFNPSPSKHISLATLNNNTFVIVYKDEATGKGEAIVGTVWFETNPPTSSINPVSQYWYTTNITLTATATDTESGVANVSLYYCFSLDNSTWSDWTLYGTDTDGSDGWNWTFDFPDGMGYYQFYSIATDKAGNTESKTTADIELGKPIPCYFTYSPQEPINGQTVLFVDKSALSVYTKWFVNGELVAEIMYLDGSHPPFNLTYTFNISNIYNITLWVYNETFDVSNTYTVNLPVKRNLTLDLSPNHIGINYVAYHLNTTTNASALMDLLNLNRGEWIHKYNESTNKWMSLWKYNDTVKLGDNFDIHPWDVVVAVVSNNRTITIDITEKVNTTQTKTLQKGYHYLSWSGNTPILSCDVTDIGLQEGDWVFKYDLKNETWLSYNVGLSGDIFEIKPYDCIFVGLSKIRVINIG